MKLAGDREHPVTRGFLCAKVARYLEREYHPDRLLYPMRRTGRKGEGSFARISWDEAIGHIAERLGHIMQTSGSEAILPYSYAGTMGFLNGSGMDRRFFHRLGASRLDRTICASAGGTALMLSQGAKTGMDMEQFSRSKLIIAWGANILATNVHLWPFIVEARRKGAKFYVIDPVATRTAKLADKHLAPYPGSDLALALGLAHVILRDSLQDQSYIDAHANDLDKFARLVEAYPPSRVEDLTGVPAADIEILAREYATTQPAAIRVNYGVQRCEQGGAAVRAIAALPVLTGAWRHDGGGLQLTTSGAFDLNRSKLERPDLQLLSPLQHEARILNMSQLGRILNEVANPRIEGLVVYNSNPAAIAPHQSQVLEGLRREDLFTVVLEHFQTDTADYADILLPATTFLEHTDLYLAYGHYYLQFAPAVVAAPGETRSNVEIFRCLARTMGFTDACFSETEDEMLHALLSTPSPYLAGITFERLREERSIRLNLAAGNEPFLPFANGFPTRCGRFEFGTESLDYKPSTESRFGPDEGLRRRYPLELVSPKNSDSMNSTFGNRADVQGQTGYLCIHPEDARLRGIEEGERIRVFNDRGSCYLRARIGIDVAQGVVAARTMGWNKSAIQKSGINALTSDRLTDIGGGPTFYNCLVEVSVDNAS